MTKVTTKTLDAQAVKEKAIKKAREKLKACRDDRNVFMTANPTHSEAARIYDNEIAKLTAALDTLLRS